MIEAEKEYNYIILSFYHSVRCHLFRSFFHRGSIASRGEEIDRNSG